MVAVAVQPAIGEQLITHRFQSLGSIKQNPALSAYRKNDSDILFWRNLRISRAMESVRTIVAWGWEFSPRGPDIH